MLSPYPCRFLAYWSQHSTQPPHFFRSLYSVLVCCGTAASFACAGLYARSCVSAASRIHASMLARVLASPLSFFHSQPIGRVLNRFSADQGIMDDLLPQTQYNYLQVRACEGGRKGVLVGGVVRVPS